VGNVGSIGKFQCEKWLRLSRQVDECQHLPVAAAVAASSAAAVAEAAATAAESYGLTDHARHVM